MSRNLRRAPKAFASIRRANVAKNILPEGRFALDPAGAGRGLMRLTPGEPVGGEGEVLLGQIVAGRQYFVLEIGAGIAEKSGKLVALRGGNDRIGRA
jgi:hypothetical protein